VREVPRSYMENTTKEGYLRSSFELQKCHVVVVGAASADVRKERDLTKGDITITAISAHETS
jgi:hypothetical protein